MDSDLPDGQGGEENTLTQMDEVDPSYGAEPGPTEVAVFDTITPDHVCSKMISLYKRSERRQRHKVHPIFGKIIF